MLLYPGIANPLDFKMTMTEEREIDSLTKNVNSLRIRDAIHMRSGVSEDRVKSKLPSNLKIIKVPRKIKEESQPKQDIANNKKPLKLLIQTVKSNEPKQREIELGIENKLQNLLHINDLPQKCELKKELPKDVISKLHDEKIIVRSERKCSASPDKKNLNSESRNKHINSTDKHYNEDKVKHKSDSNIIKFDKDNKNESIANDLGVKSKKQNENRCKCSTSKDKNLNLDKPSKVSILETKNNHLEATQNLDNEDNVKHKTCANGDKAVDINGHPIILKKDDKKDFELIARGGIRHRDERNHDYLAPYTARRPLPMVNRNSLSGGVVIEQSYPERIPSPQIPTTVNLAFLQQGGLYAKDPNFNCTSQSSSSEIDDANSIIDSLVQQLEREDSINQCSSEESSGQSPVQKVIGDKWNSIYAEDQISFDEILKELMNLPCEVPSFSPGINDGSFESNPNDNYLYSNTSPISQGSPNYISDSSYLSSPSSFNHSPYSEYFSPLNQGLFSPSDMLDVPHSTNLQIAASPTNSMSSSYSNGCSSSHGSPTCNGVNNEASVVIPNTTSSNQSSIRKLIGKLKPWGPSKNNSSVRELSGNNCCKTPNVTAEVRMEDNYKSLSKYVQRKCMEAVSKLPDTGLGCYLNDALKSLNRTESSATKNIHLAVIYIVCERLIMSNKFLQYEFAIEVNQHNSHVIVGHQLLQLAVLRYQNMPLLAQYFGECIIRSFEKSRSGNMSFEKFDFDMFRNSERNTLIHHLAARGDSTSDILASLLCLRWPDGNKVYNCNQKNIDGYTPLHLACLNNPHQLDAILPVKNNERVSYCRTIHILLKHGLADITLKDLKSGNTPLHAAVESTSCEPDAIRAILGNLPHDKQKSIMKEKNYSQHTPLDVARMARNSNKASNAAKIIVNMLKTVK